MMAETEEQSEMSTNSVAGDLREFLAQKGYGKIENLGNGLAISLLGNLGIKYFYAYVDKSWGNMPVGNEGELFINVSKIEAETPGEGDGHELMKNMRVFVFNEVSGPF